MAKKQKPKKQESRGSFMLLNVRGEFVCWMPDLNTDPVLMAKLVRKKGMKK